MIIDILHKQALVRPDAIAICSDRHKQYSYRDLYEHTKTIGQQLNLWGIRRNHRVAIALPNGADMAMAFLAITANATSAPLNPNYRASEFDFYLTDLNAKALILKAGMDSPARSVAKSLGIPVIELEPNLDETSGLFSLKSTELSNKFGFENHDFAQSDDIALVLHTSGTTARPKIVPLTQQNIYVSAQNIIHTLKLTASDRCLNIMPLFHIHGLIGSLLASISSGGSVVCTSGFDGLRFPHWLEEFLPTWYSAVPTMHQLILERVSQTDNTSLRFIRSASASLPPQVLSRLVNVFKVPVIEAYGMTEASHQIASNPLPPKVQKINSVGIGTGVEIAILDELGNYLSAGEIGEVAIKGESVTIGYENNPRANQETLSNGWFRTGDLGYLDVDGYLFLKGRIKEIINRGGEKISPREVDEILLNHPAIAQAVTFGIPHPLLGENVAVAVVLKPHTSITEQEIQEFAAQRLVDFKIPRLVIFLDEIPKGATGKIQRIGLAEKLEIYNPALYLAKPELVLPRSSLEKELAAIWLEVFEIASIGINDNFFQLGGDSISISQIVNRVRQAMNFELSFLAFFQYPTIASMAEYITSCDTQ